MACQYIPAPGRFASELLAYMDCQAASLGAQGYLALAAPGSTGSLLLLALLTIFVALFGYRMLLGDTPTLNDGVLAFVKIGIVLALTTSWPAYQTLLYDVVLRAPAELASDIGGASGLAGTEADLATRLDGVDQGLRTLSLLGVGVPVIVAPDISQRAEPSLWAGFDTFALGASRIVLLGTAAGGFGLSRLGAGFLLALGPVFVGFLLFAGTRGLFEGWLRGLVGVALGALVTAIVVRVELALLEPWVADLVAQREGGYAINGVPATLLTTALVFAGVLTGLVGLAMKVAVGVQLPHRTGSASHSFTRPVYAHDLRAPATLPTSTNFPSQGRSRAADIADAVAATQRRENHQVTPARPTGDTSSRSGGGADRSSVDVEPLGQRFRRRTTPRSSVSSRRRDGHA